MGEKVPKWVKEAADEYYCREEKSAKKLCKLIEEMPDDTRQAIVYDGHARKSRRLADWYGEHKRADTKRKEDAKKAKKDQKLIKSALSKLNKEEQEALGFI